MQGNKFNIGDQVYYIDNWSLYIGEIVQINLIKEEDELIYEISRFKQYDSISEIREKDIIYKVEKPYETFMLKNAKACDSEIGKKMNYIVHESLAMYNDYKNTLYKALLSDLKELFNKK